MLSIVTISPDRRAEWQALLQRAFSRRWGREYLRRNYFLDYVTHDPHHRRGDLVGLAVGSTLVSTCQVFRRRMVIGTRSYRVEGIGNVGTDVGFQGHGYGTVLLRGYLGASADRDAAFVYAREGALYRRLGWRRLVHHELVVRRDAVAGLAVRGALRRRRATPRELPALARIYDRFNREEALPHIARSPSYWTKWVSWKVRVYHLTANLFLDGARPVGYSFSRRRGRTLVIEEYGALPSARSRVFDAMLATFVGTRGAATLHVMRPSGSLERRLEEMRVGYEVRRVPHETGHVVLSHQALRPWARRLGLWHVDHF